MSDSRTVTYDPLVELMKRFENVRVTSDQEDAFASLSVEDKLKKHIVDGVKKNLERHLSDALEVHEPLAIINEILLDGMKTVGELFGAGKMQLPFVLQSAEVMKASVRYLEPLMEKVEGSEKGSILLATVAGDVHDIGKNLVDIILSNNGYRVVNIGIKQPIQAIIDQTLEHKCQVIGLSGLLVKSTVIMKDNLIELNGRNLHHFPVILGGAALTRSYVEQDLREIYQGQVFYAQDAFEGLRLMEQLQNTEGIESPEDENAASVPRVQSHRTDPLGEELFVFDGVRSDIEPSSTIPALPFYGSRTFEKFDLLDIYRYINRTALWRGQWQFKRPAEMGNTEFTEWLTSVAQPIDERMQRELARVFSPKVTWGYYWCASEGNDLIIFAEDQQTERHRFTFPRQRDGKRLCLSDFFLPADAGQRDVVGFQLVTVGGKVSEHERKLFADGEFQDYLYVHGFGVETAEALAEYWHQMVRREMGIDGQEPSEMKGLFGVKYQGCRYSFGYPACPRLEDQTALLDLLQPAKIGVELSTEYMLVPEQSTSAIICHHPAAKYFNVR